MAKNITADEIWDYFCDNRKELANNLHLVASDEDLGVEIYMTEEKGFPYFSVEVDEERVHAVETCSMLDAERTYERLLTTFIYSDENYEDGEDGEGEEDDGRVQDITCAVEDLVSVLIEEDPGAAGISSQDIDEIASIVEQYLYDQYGISVRHPTNSQ